MQQLLLLSRLREISFTSMPRSEFIPTFTKQLRQKSQLFWASSILLMVSLFCASSLQAQLNFNVDVTTSATTAESGEIYGYSILYSTQSPTLAATNSIITVPLPNGMELVDFQGTSHVDSFSIIIIMGVPTLEIILIDPLPAGSAGIIDIKVKVPAGSVCDGTPVVVDAIFSADNADNSPVLSNNVTTIITAGNPWNFSIAEVSVGPPGQPSIFAIDISPTSPTGYLGLQGVTATVELPTDAVFLSCDGGCVYDMVAHTLTWHLAMVTEATIINYALDVPDIDFDPGDAMSQSATFMGDYAFGCPGGPISEVSDLVTIIPMPFSAITCSPPSMTEYEIGSEGEYHARFANAGTSFEDNFTFTMTIPEEIEITNILPTRYNIEGVATSIFYTTNLNATPQLLGSFVSDVIPVGGFAPPALGVGEYLVSIIYDFGTVPPGFTAVNHLTLEYVVLETDQAGNPVVGANPRINPLSCLNDVNVHGYTCISIETTTSADGIADEECEAAAVARIPPIGSSDLTKSNTSGVVEPGDELYYKLRFRNCSNEPFTNVSILDQLPPGLEFLSMEPIIYGSVELTANLVNFTYDAIANTLSWDFSSLPGGATADSCGIFYEITYKVRIPLGTPPGQLTNCYTTDWDTSDLTGDPGGEGTPIPEICNSITVAPVIQVDSKKGVKGDCDADFIFYDPALPPADPANGMFNGVAQTFQGGTADFKLVIENTGNVAISELVVIDILPWVGDQTVSANFARLSEWRPNMMGELVVPAGITAYYSLEPNPCRTEFTPAYNPVNCTGPNWSTTPPVDITQVQAIKLEFVNDLIPFDIFEITWKMRTPVGTPAGLVAWNSFAYQGKRMDTGADFIVAEPNKAGIFTKPLVATTVSVGNYVWVDSNGNGLQDDDISLGLNGVKATIYSVGVNGIKEGPGMGDDVMVDMMLTADDFNGNPGYYLFTNLDPGSYYVVFDATTLPPGATTALLNQGADDTIDSDADATTMFMTDPTPVLVGGDEDLTLDMGIMMTSCELFPEVRVVCDNRGTSSTADDRYYYYPTVTRELGGVVDNAGTYTVKVDDATTLGNTAIIDIHTNQNFGIEQGGFGPHLIPVAELYLYIQDENDLSCTTTITVEAPVTLGYSNIVVTDCYYDGLNNSLYDLSGEITMGAGTTPPNSKVELYFTENGILHNTFFDHAMPMNFSFTGLSCDEETYNVNIRFVDITTMLPIDPDLCSGIISIAEPNCTLTVSVDNITSCSGGTYDISGSITTMNPATGIVTISFTESGMLRSVQVDPMLGTTWSITGLVCDGDNAIVVNVSYDNLAACSASTTYDEPCFLVVTDVAIEDNCLANSTYNLTFTYTTYNAPGDLNFTGSFPGSPFTVAMSVGDDAVGATAVISNIPCATVVTTETVTAAFAADMSCNGMNTYSPPLDGVMLGDTLWVDTNGNGLQDPMEPPVAGVTVELFKCNSNVLGMTTGLTLITDANGYYKFDGIPAGEYAVKFDISTGTLLSMSSYEYTSANTGGDDTKDSDAVLTMGQMAMSGCVELDPGDDYEDLDAGVYLRSKIGDIVWEDTNGNGVQDVGEIPIEGATATISGTDGFGNPYTPAVTTLTTGVDGMYMFGDLPPGSYKITFTTPVGSTYEFTAVDDPSANGDDTNDSDADPAMGGMTSFYTITSGDTILTVDAGMYIPAKLGDIVWEDVNGNGIQDIGEPFIENAKATISGTDGLGNAYGPITLMTDVNGMYMFGDLPPGSYKITFETPIGSTYEFTAVDDPASNGDDTNDSDANPAMGGMTGMYPIMSGDTVLTVDAGMYVPSKLGDFVWEDYNNNGQQDAGEPPIEGVTVTLDGTNTLGVTVGPTVLITDINGMYMFGDLWPGDYKVTFTTPADFNTTKVDEAGVADDVDSDANPAMGGMTSMYALVSGDTVLTVDGGYYATDYGDLPDTYGTSEGATGPKHIIIPQLILGTCVDAEVDGQPETMAGVMMDGDDGVMSSIIRGTNCTDDEDGVAFVTPVIDGYLACIEISVVNTTGNSAVLQGWIDFNSNGTIEPIEELTTVDFVGGGVSIPNGGVTNLEVCFDVPATANLQGGGFSRFRLSPNGGLNATGINTDGTIPQGEVEDYKLPDAKVGNLIWEDRNYNGIQDAGIDVGLNGFTVELMWAGLDNILGNADDVTYTTVSSTMGGKDGLYMFSGLIPDNYKLTVITDRFATLLNEGGNDVIDSDDENGELFTILDVTNQPLGENGINDMPGMTNPDNPANSYPDRQDNLTFDFGYAGFDYGDLPQTFTTIEADPTMPMMQGPKHLVTPLWYMGICADIDLDGQPDQYAGYYPSSAGDDNTVGVASLPAGIACADDENGVILKTSMIPGYEACYDVMTTGPMTGVMQAWADYNGNNTFDAGEEITWTKVNGTTVSTTDASIATGTDVITELCYMVPATATFPALETYLRFRYSENGGLNYKDPYGGFGGNYPFGEVEDYYQPLAELGDYVWYDIDGDGVQGTGELPVEDVVVNLHDCTDPLNPVLIATTTTDANGFYEFIGLIPMEKYCVEFDLTPINNPIVDPDDHYVFTFKDSPNADATDDNDSDVNAGTGMTDPVMMMDRERNESVDAGIYVPVSLGDYAWVDINKNGIQDAGEPPVEGAKVFLSGTNNIGEDVPTGIIVPVGQPIPPTMLLTDANGFYHFGGLAPGTYKVTFDISMITGPVELVRFAELLVFTINEQGGDDAVDSDVDPGNFDSPVGMTPFYTLESGDHVPLLDAGIAIPCLPPTDVWVDMVMITTANLHWTVNNSPLDPPGLDTYAHCWNIAIGASGFEPWENEAFQLITVCSDDPNIIINGDQVEFALTGLQPGTCYDIYIQENCDGISPPNTTSGWVNAPGTPQVGDLLGNPLESTDTNPDGLCTFDYPEIVTIVPTPPSCPFISPGYAPNGSFTVQVEDGTSCGNTFYDIVVTPVANSTPGNTTPIASTPTVYIAVPAGTYTFDNVDAGSYTVVVTEQGPCNPKNDPQTYVVVIADGVDAEDPDKVVTDILGNEVTAIGPIVLPEGACHYQMELFLFADDSCDGVITADDAVWTTVVMTPSSIDPGTQVIVTNDGFGFYKIDVNFAVGTTELTIHVKDASGNITEMTYTVVIEDNINPEITIVGANNLTIPHCEAAMDVIVTVYVSDLCDQAITAADVNFTANGTEVLNYDGGDYFEYIVTVTTTDNGSIWSATYTDADGNLAVADLQITVVQAVEDAPPVIIAADENVSQLNCDDDVICYSFQVWDDCEAIDIANVNFDAGGANMTVTYIDDQSQSNVAFFEACGVVSEGIYVMTIEYGGQIVEPILNVNAQDNQAPVITMPGNLNFTLPVCEGDLQTTIAIQVTDECDDPINIDNVIVTLCGETITPSYVNGSYFEYIIDLDAADNGCLLIASYTDNDGATTTVDALITVTQQADNWAPILIYPSQNINVEIDPCDDAVEIVCFEVTATDNCDGELIPIVTLNGQSAGVILPSPGGDTYCVAVTPGDYQVVITVTDAAGNTREEDFFISVTQDEAPEVNLACIGTFNITLNDNCEANLLAANVLTGEWGCLTEDDFEVVVIDDNPYNGDIVDGCGTYDYTITLAQDAIVEGFTGPFAPANWSVVQAAPASTVSINATTMVLSSMSANVDAMVAIAMPGDGTLHFDYDFIADVELGIGWDFFIIDIDGGVVATGNFDEVGSINETVSAGNVLVMTIEDDGFDAGTPTVLTIENFVFEADGATDAGDFTTCWGSVTAEDKTAPTIDCPDDTDEVTIDGTTFDLVCTDIDAILINGTATYATYADGTTIPGTMSTALNTILTYTGFPVIGDNCGDVWVEVTDEVEENGDCGTVVITRTFNIHDRYNKCEDSAGFPMTASCTQIITLRKPTLAEVVLPDLVSTNECDEDIAVDENGHPHPSVTGYPTITTAFGTHTLDQLYCNLAATYIDNEIIDLCEGMYKVTRRWTLTDWCEPGQTFTYNQFIEVIDSTPPSITCVDGEAVYSTGAFDCTATFLIPTPTVIDNCSAYSVSTDVIIIGEVTLYNEWGQVIGTTTGETLIATLSPGAYVSDVPKGEGVLRYTATDDCGNEMTIDCPFTVEDQITPIAICDDELHISIGSEGYARVYAEDIDEGSYDACSDVRLEVRLADGTWGEYVEFDCEDVHNYVTIELRVWDDANMDGIIGNTGDLSNLCWLEILVEDKINPYCEAPANVSMHCDDPELLHIDWTDTDQLNDIFGAATATDNCEVTAEQVSINVNINDCGWGTVIRTFRAVDGWGLTSLNGCQQIISIYEVHNYEIKFPKDASANCGIANPDTIAYNTLGCDLITVNVSDERFEAASDECYKVLRTYKVINWCEWDGESDPIVVGRDEDEDNNPGDEDVWVIVRTEWNGATPDYTTYYDNDNDETNGHWTNSNVNSAITSIGHWQYTQVIKVYDNEAPTAAVAADTPWDFCSDYADCTGDVEITFTITELCDLDVVTADGTIDLYADGAYDGDATVTLVSTDGNTNTYTISGNYSIGSHAFGIHIEDGCHNITWLEIPFEIVDCKAPTPVCIEGLTVTLMPQPDGCCAMAIWASDFIGSPITDCTEPIKYSIIRTEDDILSSTTGGTSIPSQDQTGIVLDCNDAAVTQINIYAWDSANNPYAVQPDGSVGGPNYDRCLTYISVQTHVSCPTDSELSRIAGTIATEASEGVEGVEVILSGNIFQDALTAGTGGYEFDEEAENGFDYTVTPHLDVQAPSSTSTFDIVLITKHILGVQLLDSPYKIIAADINSSETVTTADMIQLRKLILGIFTAYPNNTFWRFVDADYVFPDPTNPWLEAFPEVRNIAGLQQDELAENFIGIAIGDVNGSAIPNFTGDLEERNVNGVFALTTEDVTVKTGLDYRVSFTAADLAKVEGYQFTLTFDPTALSLTDIEYGTAKVNNFGLNYATEGMITTSWNKQGATKVEQGAILFTLVFHANTDAVLSNLLGISSRITMAEAYDNNGLLDVAINFTNGVVAANKFEVYQNTPNPFTGTTKVGYNLPTDAEVSITIQDVTGKTIQMSSVEGKKGYNAVTFDAKILGATGVLYYTVSTDEYTATKKMIVVGK